MLQTLFNRFQVRLSLLESYARFESRDDIEQMITARSEPLPRPEDQWNNKLPFLVIALPGKCRLRRQYPEDRIWLAVQANRASDDTGIGTEASLPQPMRDDYHLVVMAGLIFLRQESAAVSGLQAQNLQIAGTHFQPEKKLRFAFAGEIQTLAANHRERLQTRVAFPSIGKHAGGNCALARWRQLPKIHDLIGLLIGQRFEQHTINHAEDGRIRANSQRKRENGDRSETGVLQQQSHAIAQVSNHIAPPQWDLNVGDRIGFWCCCQRCPS